MARLASRSHPALLSPVLKLVVLTTVGGCVDAFGGANLQMDFSTPTPLPLGTDPDVDDAAPAGTYFTFYAIDNIYEEDGDGNPVVVEGYVAEVQRFEIRSVIDVTSPCFIELEDSKYPGLHVTQFANKVHAETGIDDPYSGDADSEQDIQDVLLADRRVLLLEALQRDVKAVVSYSATPPYPSSIPASDLTSAAANAERLEACRQFWDDYPDHYEGSDKVFTLPLNGRLYGTVEGLNPVNSGPLGGAQVFVDEVLSGFDAFSINWQYKDLDGDSAPDYPLGFLDTHEASEVGYPYLRGTPEQRTRGVINAHLRHIRDPNIYAEIAIFAEIGEDDVQF